MGQLTTCKSWDDLLSSRYMEHLQIIWGKSSHRWRTISMKHSEGSFFWTPKFKNLGYMVWHTFSSPNGLQSLFVKNTFNISRNIQLGEAILWEHFLLHNPTWIPKWPYIRWICRQEKGEILTHEHWKIGILVVIYLNSPTNQLFSLLIWFQVWTITNQF